MKALKISFRNYFTYLLAAFKLLRFTITAEQLTSFML